VPARRQIIDRKSWINSFISPCALESYEVTTRNLWPGLTGNFVIMVWN
jgi:hypothetical protein